MATEWKCRCASTKSNMTSRSFTLLRVYGRWLLSRRCVPRDFRLAVLIQVLLLVGQIPCRLGEIYVTEMAARCEIAAKKMWVKACPAECWYTSARRRVRSAKVR